MRVRIWRGSHEIGGNCVEVEAQGARIVLDLGRPLDSAAADKVPLPAIAGLDGKDRTLLGVIISHPHQDHYGLATALPAGLPIYMGVAAARILKQAAFFGIGGLDVTPAGPLRDRERFSLGPFRITPFLVDHSAFDSYSLLIEADGRRLFYTGDFRATGRKAALYAKLLREPPGPVDVLLMEGTLVGGAGTRKGEFPTEHDVADRLADVLGAAKGLVLVAYSGQNIDRLVSIYKACRRARRTFVVDLYTWAIARATGNPNIPQVRHGGLRVFIPHNHRVLIKKRGAFDLVRDIRPCRIYPEEIEERDANLVVTFRRSTQSLFARRASVLRNATLVWSQWHGYLDRPESASIRRFCQSHEIPILECHTSGHATIPDLQRLASALRPGRIVPIHTAAPERFAQHFKNVQTADDQQPWEV